MALMLSISINHPDVEEFILTKQDLTKVTGANMSVKLNDEFMKAVENNEDYILTYPVNYTLPTHIDNTKLNYKELYEHTYDSGEKLYYKKVKALDLWNIYIHCAWNTAEPGALFEDHHHNFSPDSCYPEYKFVTSNPCGEIAMQPYDSCRLLHHNLTSFIAGKPFTDEAKIDWALAYYLFYHGMILGDILVDLEIDAVNKIIDKISKDKTLSKKNKDTELALWNKIINSANSTRRTGIGFTGLADMLAMLNLSYTDEKALESIEKLMHLKQKAELNATIDLAILFNTFKGYDCLVENNPFFDHIRQEFPDEYSRMLRFGRRNLSWSTVNVAA